MDSISLFNNAVVLLRESRWSEAAQLLADLLEENPDYEHGIPWYDLACCYDEMGDVKKAGYCYERAIGYDRTNPIFLGGYASYLYRHGEPREAMASFSAYLNVVGEDSELGKKVRPAVEELQKKMG